MTKLVCAFLLICASVAHAQPPLRGAALLDEVQKRAVRFFREKADPVTGLVNDRARNTGTDDYTVASIASTGYGLAALPIALERRWIPRKEAEARALRTLRFVLRMPNEHGWLYHFVDRRTGEGVWDCEVSTIDTSLLVAGALVCGRYFGGEVGRLADRLYDRLDWMWARTNGGARPDKRTVTHGWKSGGFLPYEWDSYCELPVLYLLGLGARKAPLPPECWDAWQRPVYRYGGHETLAGGPIFLHQMAFGWFPLKDRRDRLGYDYWASSLAAARIHIAFCRDRAAQRTTYAAGFWGLNAGDGPAGYRAYGVPEPEDGTISPTGMAASVLYEPAQAVAGLERLLREHGTRAWGTYGFANALNVDAGWVDRDVIGIDLGMALLAIENHRTGLVWRLMQACPSTARAYRAAGLTVTSEERPRPLRLGR